jgi:uncharacterized protein
MVHQYKLNGYNIVLDTCSGSVHTVDEVAYDIIAMYQTATPDEIVAAMLEKYGHMPDVTREEILLCIDDVKALEESGKLFSKDQYEDLAKNYKNNSKVVKALSDFPHNTVRYDLLRFLVPENLFAVCESHFHNCFNINGKCTQ